MFSIFWRVWARTSYPCTPEMALVFLLLSVGFVNASQSGGEMALANVTRYAKGDLFSLIGTDCGPTRCMEVSHGTAMPAPGGCSCRCHSTLPAFREDQLICVNQIDECAMASFGRDETKPQIPFVFLPLKGQIIYPAKEIIFTDVEDAICAVSSAQYLSASGWVALRDLVDNDVPFGLYRDEGSTFLQWRGSTALHARLEGRLVTAHVLCSASSPTRLAASCAAFRVAGVSQNTLLDVRSIPFHAGEVVTSEPTTQSQGLSVLESLAIGVCVLMLVFIYAAGIIFYIHYKQKQKRKEKDPELNMSNTSTENGSTLDSRIDRDSMRLKTNPLLNIENIGSDFLHDGGGLSDVSERTEDTIDSSPNNHKFQFSSSNVVSAMVHTRRRKPARPTTRATSTPERVLERLQRRSASPDTLERAPHSDLSIVDCSIESNATITRSSPPPTGEPVVRRKLYFNPVFFESEHLKNPPPAAIDFLIKIREVMSVAKEKMMAKRFIPILSDIPEEELYHTIDLGWDIPCARRGRRFSAISLKRENSRRAIHCGGCPGCDSNVQAQKAIALARSNSCKTCASDDYKQKIVRKWLDEVPAPPTVKPLVKSVAKVSGTPRVIEPKQREEICLNPAEPVREESKTLVITESIIKDPDTHNEYKAPKKEIEDYHEKFTSATSKRRRSGELSHTEQFKPPSQERKVPSNHATRKIRKKLPPPPPPPTESPKSEDAAPMPPEVKEKMEAVIRELNKSRRSYNKKDSADIRTEKPSMPPKLVIPVSAPESQYYSDDNILKSPISQGPCLKRYGDAGFDSMERSNNMARRRRYSLDCGPEVKRTQKVSSLNLQMARDRLSQSWRDMKKAVETYEFSPADIDGDFVNRSVSVSEIFINNVDSSYDNIPKSGCLTIEVRGSPVESRRNSNEDFDPDTLDRKPKREAKKRVEKILLKSGGSFKQKSIPAQDEKEDESTPETLFNRKIGSLRQIYEAKTKVQDSGLTLSFFERRASAPFITQELSVDQQCQLTEFGTSKTPDLILNTDCQYEKPPIPPKQRRNESTRENLVSEVRRLSEERDRFPSYSKADNINTRKSGRRSARTRSRRTDLRKLSKTEDSGYLSTDSNESKRRARYLMQLRPKSQLEAIDSPKTGKSPVLQIESDTDESLCDGRSESGGESVETDSVFFGNVDDSQMFAELEINGYDSQSKVVQSQEQIDSGFVGETNIVLSGDSDSEHRSVISIAAGRDGRASAASIRKLDDAPYVRSVEC